MDRDAYREVVGFQRDAMNALERGVSQLQHAQERIARGAGAREMALAITNAQQALHWLYDAIETVGKDGPV